MASTINASTSSGLVNTADTSGVLQLQTANTTAVTIDASQNVGIGTASPASKLDVKAGSGSIIARSTSGIGLKSYYDDGRTTYTSVNYDGVSTSGAQDFYLTSGQDFYLRVNANSSIQTPLRVGTNGNFFINNAGASLIGTTDIVQIGMTAPSSGYQYGLMIGGNSTSYTPLAIRFVNTYSAAIVGYVQINSTSVTYATSSDYRLKENIAPMTGALAKVTQLKPCTYKWKLDGSDGEGFIAHELQEVVPEAVAGEKDAVNEDGSIKPQGIDTSFLVATLTAAIQEQQALITNLTTRLAALEGAK